MALLKNANLALAFLLELIMLVAFGYWGFQTGSNTFTKILLGIGVPLIAIVIWGMFLAPRSTRRLTGMMLHLVELVIFGLAAVALAAAGRSDLGIVFAAVAVINQVLLVVWKQ